MIESDISSIMSGIIRNSGQNHHPNSQEYRLLTSGPAQPSEDNVHTDLESLSWLTSVDVPRLQQMTSGRMDFSAPGSLMQQTGPMAANMQPMGAPGTVIHMPASMPPQGILGLDSMATHGANLNQYPVGAQLYPSVQSQQPPFPLAQDPQRALLSTVGPLPDPQCSPAGMYRVSYGSQPQFPPPRFAPPLAKDLHPKPYPKPIYSYSCLIAMALKNSKTGSLPVSEIYSFIKEHFPYFKTAPDGWKNSVRHNLSLNKCFEKVENTMSGSSRKGYLWALNLARIDKMEEEMHKWKRKDLAAIHRSMANPEELDKLITDRPESCRPARKLPGSQLVPTPAPEGWKPVSQLPTQPIVNLTLQAVPRHHPHAHHHIQTRARLTPDSPAPAQTPPLHALPDLHPSPLPPPPPGQAPTDFLNVTADANPEVDALDPSIVDFALQGNIWEEMKDDSFNLDTLGAFSNSPLQLSDCELGASGLTPASSGSDQSFSDLQVTGLYTTYSAPDVSSSSSSSAPYLGTPGTKPIALL
ncbi:forkhead box protein N4 [Ornithorhynchus anatinus]|uniref:forkhead box protein N4 n=1 Tax=Ornithorhynchus anatinus TaxID=9258 RepID=UPI0010A7DF71|nr:forkhead box protein N4 [Ornithorhynchus anatinus]